MRCGPPPEISGGKVQGFKKSRYLPGETAKYECWNGFRMTGASTVSCQNGTWTELPTCKGTFPVFPSIACRRDCHQAGLVVFTSSNFSL